MDIDIDVLSPHALRATAATNALTNDADIAKVPSEVLADHVTLSAN